MQFFDALALRQGEIIALIGGGGKTTTMYALGKEAAQRGLKTILTTTTKIFIPVNNQPNVIIESIPEQLIKQVKKQLTTSAQVVAGSGVTPEGKILGLQPNLFSSLLDTGADLIIIEADGAAHKPLKAPATHEPVIPPQATTVIPVVGMDCLGQVISPQVVHRPEMVTLLTDARPGQPISPELVAKIFIHPMGYRKNLPADCQWVPFINKVESPEDLAVARAVACLIGQQIPCKIIGGAALQPNPVARLWSFTFVP